MRAEEKPADGTANAQHMTHAHNSSIAIQDANRKNPQNSESPPQTVVKAE